MNILADEYLAKKSILRAIKPYWLYLIIIGKKTVEVAKSAPTDEGFDGLVYLYCTHDITSFKRIPEEARGWMSEFIGKVACVFECGNVTCIGASVDAFGEKHLQNVAFIQSRTCLSDSALFEYLYRGEGKNNEGYAWSITNLFVYDGAPLEVSAFHKPCVHIEGKSCRFGGTVGACEHSKIVFERFGERGEHHRLVSDRFCDRVLKHAPQSWQYVASMRVGESV